MTTPQRADRQFDFGTKEDLGLASLEGGLWLARRLGLHGVLVRSEVLAGVTDAPERHRRLRELLRKAITEHGVEQVQCGRGPDGKSNTYAQAFERLYQEPLAAKPTRKRVSPCE